MKFSSFFRENKTFPMKNFLLSRSLGRSLFQASLSRREKSVSFFSCFPSFKGGENYAIQKVVCNEHIDFSTITMKKYYTEEA
jgi:hypothetical protein